MTKKAFDEIAAGLNEAIAIARGKAKIARLCKSAVSDVGAAVVSTRRLAEVEL